MVEKVPKKKGKLFRKAAGVGKRATFLSLPKKEKGSWNVLMFVRSGKTG